VDVVFSVTKLDRTIRTMDYDHFIRALKQIAVRKYPPAKHSSGATTGPLGTEGEVASMARLLRHFWGSGGACWSQGVRTPPRDCNPKPVHTHMHAHAHTHAHTCTRARTQVECVLPIHNMCVLSDATHTCTPTCAYSLASSRLC